MDRITKEELKTLSAGDPQWRISLFMSAHRAGRDTEQNSIRLKNLVRRAEEGLAARGLRTPEIQEMLAPARKLVDDPLFWQRQSDGFALFLSPDIFRFYRLPLSFQELAVVSPRFYFIPLLPLLTGEGRFYILALSQNRIRLMEATRHTVDEVDAEALLPSFAEVLQFDHFERQLQFRTGTPSGRVGARPAMFHGHDPSEDDKVRILRWFHRIDDDLPELLRRSGAPLVLAGVEYLLPLYKEANSYPHLLEEGVTGNPDDARPEELHVKAWPIVERIFTKSREQAAERYGQLAGTGQTSVDLEEILTAAYHGRVDVLFLATDAKVWGHFIPDGENTPAEEADEDLLNLAAVQTLLNGGVVHAVEKDLMPEEGALCAIFRY